MSFTLLSVLFVFMFAAIAFKEIYTGIKKGFYWSLISLGADVLALFVSFFLNTWLSSAVTGSIIAEFQKIQGYDEFALTLPSLYSVLRSVVLMLLGSIFYIFIFLLVRKIARTAAIRIYVSHTELAPDDPGYGCEDRSVPDRLGRARGAVCGFLSAVLLVSAVSAPVVGTLKLADNVLYIVKQTDTRVYNSIGPGNAAMVRSFSNDITANIFYRIGGETIYANSASCYVSGKKMYLHSELETISDMSGDMLNVYKIFLTPQEATQEHSDSLRRLSENLQELKLFESLAAELIRGCATAWQNGESFLTIYPPEVPPALNSVFDSILSVCSKVLVTNVKQNTATMLEAYALILESGICSEQRDNYDKILQRISNSGLLGELESLLQENSYMQNVTVSEVAMSALASSVLQEGTRREALIADITDALKEVNASGKSVTSKTTSLAGELRNIFAKHGISLSTDFTRYAASRMIGDLPGQNVDTGDVTRMLEKYDVRAN